MPPAIIRALSPPAPFSDSSSLALPLSLPLPLPSFYLSFSHTFSLSLSRCLSLSLCVCVCVSGVDGNWRCPQCQNINFGKRDRCNRCSCPKPPEYGGPSSGSLKIHDPSLGPPTPEELKKTALQSVQATRTRARSPSPVSVSCACLCAVSPSVLLSAVHCRPCVRACCACRASVPSVARPVA